MVLMSIRNHVRVDIRFWLFHDGDGRTRSSSWSNPFYNLSRVARLYLSSLFSCVRMEAR